MAVSNGYLAILNDILKQVVHILTSLNNIHGINVRTATCLVVVVANTLQVLLLRSAHAVKFVGFSLQTSYLHAGYCEVL